MAPTELFLERIAQVRALTRAQAAAELAEPTDLWLPLAEVVDTAGTF